VSQPMKNATYLFELPARRYHSSESWWTAFFSMLILYRSRQEPQWSLPAYVSRAGCPLEKGTFAPGRLGLANLIVEAPLSENPFSLTSWPNEFLQLKPDVCILRREERHVVFVEVKTIGASVARNHSRYLKICEHLRQSGWSAELYYLLSHGHECVGDWPLIENDGVRVILWEDVLRAAIGTPLGEIFDQSLSEYATRPC
jgi:hypothetical protein